MRAVRVGHRWHIWIIISVLFTRYKYRLKDQTALIYYICIVNALQIIGTRTARTIWKKYSVYG